MFNRLSFLIAAISALCFFQTQAFAHSHLAGSVPASGSSVAEIKEIRLDFNEGINPTFSGVDLKDAAGNAVATGPASVDPANKKKLIVPIPVKLAPGSYTVEWHAVGGDTHRVKGQFTFKVIP